MTPALAHPFPTTLPTPRGKPIFGPYRASMWSWRNRVKRTMLAFAGRDLPAGKRRRDWKTKAHAFGSCGRQVAALACNGCNNIAFDSGTIVATCGLRICPICARRKAQKLRHRLRAAWDSEKRDRRYGLYFLTFTMRYDPSDPSEVTATALLERKNTMMAAWASVWRQYLKRRAMAYVNGRPKITGAACRAIEVGSSGMVHLHVLYLGRRPDVMTLRLRWMDQVGDSPIVNVRYCRDPRKAIVELAKYVTKGASPAKASIVSGQTASFMDPELAVRVEIAFSGDRMVQCYGQWLGISVDDDEDTEEEKVSAEALHAAACPHCGLVGEWHAAAYDLEEWFSRFGDELADWKPRIGGSGPRKRKDVEDGKESYARDGRAGAGEYERARALILGRGRRAAGRNLPAWTAGAVVLTGGQGDPEMGAR